MSQNKIKKNRRSRGLAIGTLAFFMILADTQTIAQAAELPMLQTQTSDTVAGYTTLVKTESPFPNQEIIFKIVKPDQAELIIHTTSNQEGEATIDLYDYHTKQAGIYEAAAKFDHQDEFGPYSSFQVYADEVSAHTSFIETSKTTVMANGYDSTELTVNLKDRYGNPIANHQVSLVPSRPEDKIAPISETNTTSDHGQVKFGISSGQEGVSTISGFDTTNNIALEQRVRIVFFKQQNFAKSVGGHTDVLLSQVKAESDSVPGELSYFGLQELPSQAKINETLTFKLAAYDSKSNVSTNYTGTVRFSSTDNNATLPGDYEFKAEDLGVHIFSLGLTFLTTGTQTLTVKDINNPEISGEAKIEIVSSDGTGPKSSAPVPGSIMLEQPTSGTYQTPIVSVSGRAPVQSALALYINDEQVKTASADQNGSFIFETTPLPEGKNLLYVAITDKDGNIVEMSDTRTVTIDKSPPRVDSLELDPAGAVLPQEKIQATLYSENNLSSAAIIIDNKIIELIPSLEVPGTYTSVFSAPESEGTYPIDVISVDELGNEATYTKQKILEVSKTKTSGQFVAQIGSGDNPPAGVKGVEAIPGNARVTLYWETPQDNTYITNYRVYYGTASDDLAKQVDTFTNNNTWYVPNLTNGTTYYFALTALDSDGNESQTLSSIVSATPRDTSGGNTNPPKNQPAQTTTPPPSQSTNQPTTQTAKIETPPPEKSPGTGPETLIILLVTLFFTNVYIVMKSKSEWKTIHSENKTTPKYGYRFRK